MKDTEVILCPYCAQSNEIYIDFSGGEQQAYIEECQVCCRPWEVRVSLLEDEPQVSVHPVDQ